MGKTAFIVLNVFLAVLTIILASASLIFGSQNPVYGEASIPAIPALDSNLRFLGGIGIGLGLALLWSLAAIENRGTVFRIVWITALLGGLGRLLSWIIEGQPPLPMISFTIIELFLVPFLLYWQVQLSKGTH